MQKPIKLSDLNIERPEGKMLLELTPEIANFRKNFKGDLAHTYILTPYGSSMFGFDIHDDTPYLGVPEKLFDLFLGISFESVTLQKGKPGVYLVFFLGERNKGKRTAVRIFLRSRRVVALDKYKEINIIKMNSSGEASFSDQQGIFEMKVSNINCLNWEE